MDSQASVVSNVLVMLASAPAFFLTDSILLDGCIFLFLMQCLVVKLLFSQDDDDDDDDVF